MKNLLSFWAGLLLVFGSGAAEHAFTGVWITDAEMAAQKPRPVKARQLKRHLLPPEDKDLCNRHILFRKAFELGKAKDARVFITADDCYKLYVNGVFAGQGPAAGTVEHTYYNEIDVTKLLKPGRNVLAVHTYYQGLVNRVWVSGDRRHGLILDLVADGKTVVASDAGFRVARHTGYAIADIDNGWCGRRGTAGYDTQFLERYDAGAPEVGFERPTFDDAKWAAATPHPLGEDYRLFAQPTPSVVTEDIGPVSVAALSNGTLRVDFGGIYVGGLVFAATGPKGAEVVIRCGQELNADGSVRHRMRCNCDYVEQMILSGGPRDEANPFDYKSFRYAEIAVPKGAAVDRASIVLRARHAPFVLKAKPNIGGDRVLRKVWELGVSSFRYGVQEQIMDCMDREKGYYLGDGIYTMYANCVLTQDWAPARRFFDDFLRTSDIDPGLVTCANCAFMQEIAEYPLMLILFARMYLEATGDTAFVAARYDAFARVLDSYRARYARDDGMLTDLDKWCVVEWPQNYQDGYDADVREGKVCTDVHNAVNAWYVGAVKTMNALAGAIGRAPYADAAKLQDAFDAAFWDAKRKVFVDRVGSTHASMPANTYAAFFDLAPEKDRAAFKRNFLKMIREKYPDAVSMFQYMPLFFWLEREGERKLLLELVKHPGAWPRMLDEGATRSVEGWGREAKSNASLFHLTMASVVVFLTDAPAPSAAPVLPKDNAICFDNAFRRMAAADVAADAAWSACDTAERLAERQRAVKARILEALGPMPAKCPLDAKTTGRVPREGYAIEKVIFASEPNHHVTAHVFLPSAVKFPGKRPGIVIPCGHSWDGKAEGSYQRGALQAAQKGLVALVYDPLDQGERVQSRRKPSRCCEPHNAVGRRAELLGWSMARFRLRDGMRALDYLASRPEVDPARLGVAGHSGGGTMTSWIMAMDDRVKAAAPSGFLSTLRDVCREIGPQDAEQTVFGELAFGFNHLGHILLRAPSPVLMCASHGDFFPITGSLGTAQRAQAVYAALGAPNAFALSDTLLWHHWHESTRAYATDWLALKLGGVNAGCRTMQDYRNLEYGFVEAASDLGINGEAANVTPKGAVLDLPGERSVYDLMAEEATRQKKARTKLTPETVRRVAGIRTVHAGADGRESGEIGYALRNGNVLVSDEGYPVVLHAQGRGRPVLYVTDGGRYAAKPGERVYTADIRGFGENGRLIHTFYGVKSADEELAILHGLVGEHLVGRRAEDILAAARQVAAACGRRPKLLARGRAAIPAAHAHYVAPELFEGLEILSGPPSWETFLREDATPGRFADVVRGAWAHYDWTDLKPDGKGM